MRRGRFLVVACVVAIARALPAQAPAASSLTIELAGPAGQTRTLSAAEVRALPSVEVDVSSHNVHGKYRGVPLGDLLRLVGRPAGDSLRGTALAQDVIVEASDGYRVVFAPAELDAGFTDKAVILAYDKDGKPLDQAEGPFRVIAVGEKRPARWVRGVVRIRLRPGTG
jgi:hypothetical protein